MMAYSLGGSNALTAGEIRTEFSVKMLSDWAKDPKNKGLLQCISKRIDVIMCMECRSRGRDECTKEQLRELELFNEQFRNKNALRKKAISKAEEKAK